jgi:surface carbohydrate biosynthesis protein
MVWLSINLVSQGHKVIIGETASIRNGIDIIDPDIWIRGGLSDDHEKLGIAKEIKNAGGGLVIIDSEGGLAGEDDYKRWAAKKEMADLADLHFVWGEWHKKILTDELSDYEDTVIRSGNPRFDLLSEDLREVYSKESSTYTKKYGNFILIPTNFSKAAGDSGVNVSDQKLVKYHEKLVTKYTTAINQLARDIDYNIVVRPHPREKTETYRSRLSTSEGVYIEKKGNARGWIASASALVHKSSTTGIEAALLNIPVFSYRPYKNKEYDSKLPILVSEEVNTYSQLYQALNSDLSRYSVSLSPETKEKLKNKIYNIDNEISAKKIASEIDSANIRKQRSVSGTKNPIEVKIKRSLIPIVGGDIVEYLGEKILGTNREGVRNKFPSLSAEELQSEINLFRDVCNSGIPEIKIKKVDKLINTFVLESS